MKRITMTVNKPEPIDNGALDTIFSRSLAISDAVSNFWKLGIASKAELGQVTENENGFNVEIIY